MKKSILVKDVTERTELENTIIATASKKKNFVEVLTGVAHQLDNTDKNTLIEYLGKILTGKQREFTIMILLNEFKTDILVSCQENGIIEYDGEKDEFVTL